MQVLTYCGFHHCLPTSCFHNTSEDVRRPGRARMAFMDSAECPFLSAECNVYLSNLHRHNYANLQYSKISDEGMAFIADVFRNIKSVKGVNLSHNLICDEGAEKLFEALANHESIVELNLSYNRVTDDMFLNLGTLFTLTLTELQLSDNTFTDDGVTVLAESLRKCPQVKKLMVSNCLSVSDRSAVAFSESLKDQACGLTYLDLSHNQITDVGAQAFASMILQNVTFKTLYLGMNRISDVGAVAISEAMRCPTTAMVTIDLYHNRLTDVTALSFAKTLEMNTKIISVNVAHNDVGAEGVEALRVVAKALSNKTRSIVVGVFDNPGTKIIMQRQQQLRTQH
eukprot:PhF_6_TR42787/c0_g1_i1/m.64737